ncbi:MAG TPA: hypothetical protein PKE47_14915, partial [Verrucomicrobiota bacterium]|nr:hypothetical protein [Verrucomicrobiota bacterium]
LGLLLWNYARGPRGWVRWAAGGLEFLGLALLALCLLEPHRTGERARPGANLFAVVADNSQGLGIRDAGETRTRGELLRETLGRDWLGRLAEDFELRRYLFDTRLQTTRDFGDLDFSGRATALGTALRGLRERHAGRPLAGVLLFTDGNATDLAGPLPDLTGLPPVYPVVVGRRDAVRDLALAQVGVTTSAFEDAPVTVQAEVTAAGFAGEPAVARLVDPAGREVARQNFRGADRPVPLRFALQPEQPGLSFLRLEVALAAEAGRASGDTNSAEATLANNAQVLAVERGGGPYRVLYVAGRPNWEFKFLNRASRPIRRCSSWRSSAWPNANRSSTSAAGPARRATRSSAASGTRPARRPSVTTSPCSPGSTRATSSSCAAAFRARRRSCSPMTRSSWTTSRRSSSRPSRPRWCSASWPTGGAAS